MAKSSNNVCRPTCKFFLSIFIFSLIFLNTPDPQTTAVIKKVDESINIKSSNEFILPGDQIVAINSTMFLIQKISILELLSYAGFTGTINLTLKRKILIRIYKCWYYG